MNNYIDNYIIYHIHTDISNGFTVLDSIDTYLTYINMAKENGMEAMAISEHGSILNWLKKKEYMETEKYVCKHCGEEYKSFVSECKKCKSTDIENTIHKMKYIHAIEAYVTESLDEKVRDNNHIILIAKNWDGVMELNRMSSKSFNREDGHFYFNPRMTYDEIKSTSDNIIITTACLGGILNKGSDEYQSDFIDFLSKNKHRSFLEIQHHNVEDQINYNKKLYQISKDAGVPLIAGTDTHCSTASKLNTRKLAQERKGVRFDNEDGWDLLFKSYEELVSSYDEQNSLPKDVYMQAIENTNVMAGMIEEFEMDRSNKYPKLYNNSMEMIKDKISTGYKDRMKNKVHDKKVYNDRIKYELKTMRDNGSIDYILLEDLVKSTMRSKGIYPAYSRGSCSGSQIAYLTRITDIDAIKYNMSFERFMNPERVSLCDIDSDWAPSERGEIKKFLHNMNDEVELASTVYISEIVTFNRWGINGAIRDVAPMLNYSYKDIDSICSNIESDEPKLRKKHKELFKYVDDLIGVIFSIGTHAAGTIVSPIPLEDNVGTFTSSTNNYPISQLNMKEIDSLNFVKLDILGLDNWEVILKSCKLAGIDTLVPDNMDFSDQEVWDNMLLDPIGMFQFEGDFAHSYLRKVFRKSNIDKMKANMIGIPEELKTIIILGIVNGAIRPAGASYRDALANGDYNDNGHKVLNDFLSPTLGYLIFQEQIIEFLNRFCGFTMGEADTVRRGFAKKTGTEKYIPRITSGFIKIMHDEYGVCKKESEAIIISFLKVIEDASFYLFSKNHADPYSMLGFATAYLRTYHPLEFFTSMLEVNLSNMDKTNQIMKYINKFTNIRVKPAQFGRSTAHYSCSKENNTIYKGIASIKTLGVSVGDAFEKLNSGSYKTFMDALDGIYQYDNVMYIRRYERALKDDLKVLKKQWKEDGFNKDEIKEKNEVEKTIIANKVKDERVMCPTNQLVGDSAIELLIGLSFFKEYGKSQYLINILKAYSKIRYAMALKKSSLESLDIEWIKIIINNSKETDSQYSQLDTDKILPEIIDIIQDVDISIDNCLLLQAEYLGYINGELIENPPSKYCIINMVNKRYTPYLRLQSLTGKQFDAKIDKRTFNYKLEQGDILELRKIVKKPQYKMVGEKTNGKPDYVEDKTKPLIIWVTDYRVVEKGGE